VYGAFSAVAFYGVGQSANLLADKYGTAFWGSGSPGRVVLHGAAGCASASVAGGSCGHGAVSAAFAEAAGPNVSSVTGGSKVAGFVGAVVAGGGAARLSGGKFANGAATGAFSYLYNELAHYKGTPDERLALAGYSGGVTVPEETSRSWGSYLPGTEAGDRAAQYWADMQVRTGNPLYAVPGTLASLWTPDTATTTALTLGSAGAVSIAERAGVLWMRAYPNAGGEGLGVQWSGRNLIRFDWHQFTLNGERVFRPHVDIPSMGIKHWPW
jgi:hypothetical protein